MTPGSNKAFLWWRVHGTEKNREEKREKKREEEEKEEEEEEKTQGMWGINMLEYDCEGKVKRIVGFRQPLLTEQQGGKMESGKQPYMETLSAEE